LLPMKFKAIWWRHIVVVGKFKVSEETRREVMEKLEKQEERTDGEVYVVGPRLSVRCGGKLRSRSLNIWVPLWRKYSRE
jgi:hypothetical protein